MVQVTLLREWGALEKMAEVRRAAAGRILEHLLSSLPQGSRGTDLLAETTLGKLLMAVNSDLMVRSQVREPSRLVDRALLWLHEQEVIRLNKGLAVFRPAMTIRLKQERRGFAQADYGSLKLHYDEQTLQIHVMAEFAQQGLDSMAQALRLAMDYFRLLKDDFLSKWLPGRDQETSRQTTPESWRSIVEGLNNPVQRRIVADDPGTDQCPGAGRPGLGQDPGAGAPHRLPGKGEAGEPPGHPGPGLQPARCRGDPPEVGRPHRRRCPWGGGADLPRPGHAAHRRQLHRAGEPAGRGGLPRGGPAGGGPAQGEGLPPEDADDQRARLLAGFRWILVDEYQDIGPDQYELTSALAGRTLSSEDDKLSLFAVGDDDQNIYAFNGSSTELIRRFEADYRARPVFLTDNYRSTAHIIEAANAVIDPAAQRMKVGHPIAVNRARARVPYGGDWALMDPVTRGQVQTLPAGDTPIYQAQAVVAELKRLSSLDPEWDWSTCAVVAREWSYLDPVRSLCELEDIPAQMANEEFTGIWQLRETRVLVDWMRHRDSFLLTSDDLEGWVREQPPGPWNELLQEAVSEYALETGGSEAPVDHFIEWLAEWARDVRRRQRGLLLLTAHRAKGLEFDHVVVLDGAWGRVGLEEDSDSPRRLYYVAMTRARKTLTLVQFPGPHPFLDSLRDIPSVLHRDGPAQLPLAAPELARRYRRLSLRDVFLSFAGYRPEGHPVHNAIANLSPGDPLRARQGANRWELLDRNGTVVGQLAGSFDVPSA